MPIEEPGHYLVTLTGLVGDEPPTDPDGFEAFAVRMEHPLVAEWLAAARAQGPPFGYRGTANIRRRYDRLGGPEGLLVVGDATTAFNPLYGQGISVAALGAQALRRAMTDGHRSQRRLQTVVFRAGTQAWNISSAVDRSMPGATGNAARSTVLDQVAGWYLGRVQDHAAGNSRVAATFRDVLHLDAPVTSLFAWWIARTVLFGRLRPALATPPLLAEPATPIA
jgi:flavin-dependent dehydrogenase